MKKYNFNVLIERDEDGVFIAKVPALKGCYTQANSYEDLIPRIKEAIELCLEASNLEEVDNYSFEGVQRIEVEI